MYVFLFDSYEQRLTNIVMVLGALLVPGAFLWFVLGGVVLHVAYLFFVCFFREPAFLFGEHPNFDYRLHPLPVLLSWAAVIGYIGAAVATTQIPGPFGILTALVIVLGGVALSFFSLWFEQR